MEQTMMMLIVLAGNAKSLAMESILKTKNNRIEDSAELLKKAHEKLKEAYVEHSKLLAKSAEKEEFEINLLLIHSEDHLMAADITLNLAQELIGMQKEINQLKVEIINIKGRLR